MINRNPYPDDPARSRRAYLWRRAVLITMPPWYAMCVLLGAGILFWGWPIWLIVAVPFALLPFLNFWLYRLEDEERFERKQAKAADRDHHAAGAR